MAFRISVVQDLEFRGLVSGVSTKTGKTWMTAKFENDEAEQLEISIPNDMQGDFYSAGIRKGDFCAVSFVAVARADGNAYLMMRAIPEVLEDEE